MRFYLLFPLVFCVLSAYAQKDVQYDGSRDTLLVVGGSLIDNDKFLLDRKALLENDTVFVNKEGLEVHSFVFSAFSLGQKVTLKNDGNVISGEVKCQLTNNETNFKFFYLKDIILRDKVGRECSPTSKTLKITFTN